ncbi:hypothetical protein EJV46_11255 [Roseococcus sp. SYP-B2431]|uniref:hypothetical protein n=1 Tax=Roseococcus sp. SYP-B2431 TaxID=2496640 RepID=UPI00103B827B|nr:hypothetical protein [Roseococcus sp. SYP-B2431]TCH99106.1 hypothetical protein EJV46_11255 [Roseococcus sp. SYP-B2431]
MSVTQEGPVIRLEGLCRVEDAEVLAALLQRLPGSAVDLTRCEGLHAAVAQAILALAPPLTGVPADPFLRELLLPALAGERQRLPPRI